MSDISKFSVREWLVPPVLLPIFFVLLIAAAMLIQWYFPSVGLRRQLKPTAHSGQSSESNRR